MQTLGHHLFASTGLTQDQDIGLGVRHLFDQMAHHADGQTLAHQYPGKFIGACGMGMAAFLIDLTTMQCGHQLWIGW